MTQPTAFPKTEPPKPAGKRGATASKPAPTKSVQAAKKPVPTAAVGDREKIYHKKVAVFYTDHPEQVEEGYIVKPALRIGGTDKNDTVTLLGIETEKEYHDKIMRADPSTDPLKAHFKDENVAFSWGGKDGTRVALWRSSKNRPFDLSHAEKLAQDHLNLFWKFNGEAIIVDEYGEVISGQHRLAAHWIAEMLRKSKTGNPKHPFTRNWPGPVTMECLVVYGVSSDPTVLRTLDNVRPRTLSDTIYTSPIFADLNPTNKKECSRMLDAGVDVLWQRTGAGDAHVGGPANKFQTHSSSLEFLERHAKLKQCVRHVFSENAPENGRKISAIESLNVGHCSALMYLMAASETNPDDYRNMDLPSEKALSFSRWDKAVEFFTMLGTSDEFKEVRLAIKSLKVGAGLPPEEGGSLGGTAKEKASVLVKAWFPWIESEEIDRAVLDLAECYTVDAKGLVHFDHIPSLGGIDKEEQTPEEAAADREAEPATPEEVEAAKKVEREAKIAEITRRLQADREAKRRAKREARNEPIEGQSLADEAKDILSKRATSRRDIEAQQTARAALADQEMEDLRTAEQEVDAEAEADFEEQEPQDSTDAQEPAEGK